MQPITTAAAGLFVAALQKDGAQSALMATACIGLALVIAPSAEWLYRAVWVWRGDRCPYRQGFRRLPELTPTHWAPCCGSLGRQRYQRLWSRPEKTPAHCCTLFAAAICTVRRTLRRCLHPTDTEAVWSGRRVPPPSASNKQYLEAVSHYSVSSCWFLAVDVGIAAGSGMAGGVGLYRIARGRCGCFWPSLSGSVLSQLLCGRSCHDSTHSCA